MTFTDKTTDIYHLTREQYEKILNDPTTATYKKASNHIKKKMLLGSKSCITTKF